VNILYIYQGEWPRAATRVVKQVRSLAGAGHRVHLLARNYQGQPRLEQWERVQVHRLPSVRARRLNRVLNFPFFFNPVWVWAMWRLARRTRADRIVVADLPLAPTAIWLGRVLRIPVLYDMAEVYPEFLKTLHAVAERPLWDHVIRSPRAAAVVERWALKRAGSISVVSEESRLRSVRLGASADRVALVGNTPDNVAELTCPRPFPAELRPWAKRPRALFVGTLIADRGVKEVVDALPLVVREIPDVVLIVVGDGPDRPRIALTVERHGLGEHVALVGWRDHERLTEFYQHCQVGLLPFLDTPHVRLTLANKLFDYMGASLAVLAADLPPMRRILEETEAGVLYPAGNGAALATQLARLLGDPEQCRVLGMRGREAVQSKYHWGRDAATWLGLVAGAGAGARKEIRSVD